MIRKTVTFTSRFVIIGIVLASGLGIISSPKVTALSATDNTCRAVLILDHSGSVGGNVGNLKDAAKSLFGAKRIGNDKIALGFWSFSGNGNRWYGGSYNNPHSNGFVPSTSTGADAQDAKNRLDTLVSEGSTFYNWALGYDGSPGHITSPTRSNHRNPDIVSLGDNADVLVFTTDGAPTPAPDDGYDAGLVSATAARGIVQTKYFDTRPDYPRTIVGAVIDGSDTLDDKPPGVSNAEAKRRLVRVVVNGSETDGTNVFDVDANYANFADKVRTLVISACDYKLTPTLTLPASRIEPGEDGDVNGKVANNSIRRKSINTEWRITRIAYPPGTRTFASLDNRTMGGSADPCTAINSNGINHPLMNADCNPGWRNNTYAFSSGDTLIDRTDNNIPTAIGSIVCYFLSVKPPGFDEPDTAWEHSKLRCVMVAKSPKVHITGGDVRSLGTIYTHYNRDGSLAKWFGSWVEYGAFAVGGNGEDTPIYNRIASGRPSNSQYAFDGSGGDALSFKNDTSPNYFGYFGSLGATNLQSNFPLTDPGMVEDCSPDLTHAGKNKCTTGSGNVTIGDAASDTAISGTVIIRATGTVTINGNLLYNENIPRSDTTNLPQLVIIANKIHIRDNVERIFAWLVTTGSGNEIDTCINGHDNVTNNFGGIGRVSALDCDKKLRVDGPVKTSKLRLFRTAGAEVSSRGASAEEFNFRPDAYLWLYNYRQSSPRVITSSIQELPPRY